MKGIVINRHWPADDADAWADEFDREVHRNRTHAAQDLQESLHGLEVLAEMRGLTIGVDHKLREAIAALRAAVADQWQAASF